MKNQKKCCEQRRGEAGNGEAAAQKAGEASQIDCGESADDESVHQSLRCDIVPGQRHNQVRCDFRKEGKSHFRKYSGGIPRTPNRYSRANIAEIGPVIRIEGDQRMNPGKPEKQKGKY